MPIESPFATSYLMEAMFALSVTVCEVITCGRADVLDSTFFYLEIVSGRKLVATSFVDLHKNGAFLTSRLCLVTRISWRTDMHTQSLVT